VTKRQWIAFDLISVAVVGGLVAWGLLQAWEAGIALGVAGIAVSTAGFTIAIQQIRTTRGASIAAAHAVSDALRTMASVRLSALLPILRHEMDALETAVRQRDSEGARRALNSWRGLSLDAVNALAGRIADGHRVLKQVEKAREAALDAKSGLYDPPEDADAFTKVQREMEMAFDELAIAVNELVQREVEDG
jgi:hypothetical protein